MRTGVAPKKKNNHFVPRSYLKRFCSGSDRQICLYNIRTDREIEHAPIKSQCSKSYFYTKNPAHEERFTTIEGGQAQLLNGIILQEHPPERGSPARDTLDICLMFQASRTAAAVAQANHLANEFGKAILQHHLENEGKHELLEYLPQLKINIENTVFDSIRQHLLMVPLISDLNCCLLLNDTDEDFLTSDHPVVNCSSMPALSNAISTVGFASRGLIVLYPISPRALLMWSDPEVYHLAPSNAAKSVLKNPIEVVELNLMQFASADENVYFSDRTRVQRTLAAFRKRKDQIRRPRPRIKETVVEAAPERTRFLLEMARLIPRLNRPKALTVRYAASKGRFQVGDAKVRDPAKAAAVKQLMNEVERRRNEK
jgi:Protein of unknown function (DUF4238)